MTKQRSICTRFLGIASVSVTFLTVASQPALCQASPQAHEPATQAEESPLPNAVFEVASIHQDKPSQDGRVSMQMRVSPDGTFTGHGLSLSRLISNAYGVDEFRVSGAPGWLSSNRYTIEAKPDSATQEQLPKLSGKEPRLVEQRMVQALLADRFKLILHLETREIPILALVVAKSGSKLHESIPGDTYANGLKDHEGNGHPGMMRFSGGSITAQGIGIEGLTKQLSEALHQVVQDHTGLKGIFDFVFEWTPDQNADRQTSSPLGNGGEVSLDNSSGPSIFTALQEQLGLKLESTKGPVQMLVIDHIEQPSEN